MTTGQPMAGGDLLRRAVAAVDWTPERHLRALAERSLAAVRAGDAALAWLLADRLVRISNGQSALPYVLRASALALLGDARPARADLDTARLIDPDDRLVNEALTRFDEPAARRRGATHLLLAGDEPGLLLALKTLDDEGFRSVIRAEWLDGVLRAQIFWRQDTALDLVIDDGRVRQVLTLAPAPSPSTGPFGVVADVALPWPDEAEAVVLSASLEPCFAAPPVLRRLADPAQAPAEVGTADDMATGGQLLVIVPAYDDPEGTAACLDSLEAALPAGIATRIIVIDDRSPDPRISLDLDERAAAGRIQLLRNPLNLGFAASVNRALNERLPGEDVLLLNADTLLTPGVIGKLAAAAYRDPAIGTVTPLSNNGEDTSFPLRFAANPMPDPRGLALLDRIAEAVNGDDIVDMPNGVGFCLYIKAAVAGRLGALSLAFGRGYYEDVEYCLRAAEAGFRNVCATGAVVGHSGSRSFKAEKRALVRRNLPVLANRFPDYRAASTEFFRADPLAGPVGRIEEALIVNGPPIRLAFAPQGVPDWLVSRLADDSQEARLVIARVGADAISLRAADDGVPQNILWPSPDGDAGRVVMLAERLPYLPLASIVLIDPFDLPRGLATICEQRDVPVSTAIAACDASTDALRRVIDRRHTIALVGKGMAGWLRHVGYTRIAVKEPEPSVPPPIPAAPGLAILAETGGVAEWRLARAVASRLKAQDHGPAVYLGQPDSAEPIDASDAIFATGALSREESAGWLGRIGGAACLFASRRFGLSDPRAEAWAAAGVPVALFDPVVKRPVRRGAMLRLPCREADEAIAEAIVGWLGLAAPQAAPLSAATSGSEKTNSSISRR